ncbi:MAG: SusD/RagB family nutrient-binding outer membrane lipoprotein [Cyclobacteriaceae bacterium]|nr:SusD/RagB family nutrient-binding outer membrane lipoprotein [Cyclobacteriaceae bacterium]
MNKRLTFKTGIAAIILLIGSSCSSWLDDNISPNNLSSVPVTQLLPSMLGQFGFAMGGSDLFRYSAIWSQQITAQNGRQTESYSLYNLADSEVNGVWRTTLYAGILADAEEILKRDPATTHPRYFGMAKFIKAFTYSVLVDFWGDIPFSEALQGVSNTQPAIDDDAAVYPQLITLLDQAIVDFKATSGLIAPAADDYVYGGNAAKWIKAANVLKLRMYLKMANVATFNTATISTFITNTPAAEFMESIADDYQQPFVASLSGRMNPAHQFIVSRTDDICSSSTIINLMNAKADPRRMNYFTPAPFSPALYSTPPTGTDGYVGLLPGNGNGGVNNGLSRLHRFVRGAVTTAAASIPAGPTLGVTGLAYDGSAPANILTYAEYNFIRAELALRYSAPVAPKASVEEWYREGITASILDASHPAKPLVAADATAYLDADPDGDTFTNGTLHGTQEEQLRQIIEEKYVANFMVTGEAWCDWRRTGYPLLQLLAPALNPGNNNKVPRSIVYPQQEVDANPKLSQKPNMSVRVFWDTRTTGQE